MGCRRIVPHKSRRAIQQGRMCAGQRCGRCPAPRESASRAQARQAVRPRVRRRDAGKVQTAPSRRPSSSRCHTGFYPISAVSPIGSANLRQTSNDGTENLSDCGCDSHCDGAPEGDAHHRTEKSGAAGLGANRPERCTRGKTGLPRRLWESAYSAARPSMQSAASPRLPQMVAARSTLPESVAPSKFRRCRVHRAHALSRHPFPSTVVRPAVRYLARRHA